MEFALFVRRPILLVVRRRTHPGLLSYHGRHRLSTANAGIGETSSPPSWYQLLLHARLAAVPMIGFGFMDNIIMIQAGDLIDHTLGVRFGFSTLVAAALGNLCSDASGVLFGSVVESAASKLNLRLPHLTPAQACMTITRRAGTIGQLLGVMFGCCLGSINLLFMDLDGAERLKMQKKLDTVWEPVLQSTHLLVKAERCTLYLYDEEKGELWTRAATESPLTMLIRRLTNRQVQPHVTSSNKQIISLSIHSKSLAATAARERRILNVSDAKTDPRHDTSWDAKTGTVTHSVLSVPILNDGKLYGCLQAINKVADGEHDMAGFTDEDEHLLTMVSNHISIFVRAVMDE